MIKGSSFTLRTLTEADLPEFARHMADIQHRGVYYPGRIYSQWEIRHNFEKDGFWAKNNGLLLIVNEAGSIIGDIEFFKPVVYWNAFEIAYIMFDPQERGNGIITEATQLLVRYLFDNFLINRIHLCISPENHASMRVAEKCGFTLEGTLRGVHFNGGRHHDLNMYSLLREEHKG